MRHVRAGAVPAAAGCATWPAGEAFDDGHTMALMSGGEALARAVLAHGIDTVFGVPGAQVYPLFDALHRLGARIVVPRHEQAAGYMAYGAARSTGRPAAFAVVPGPGVLNTAAALVTAMGGCAPVICLTGQVPSQYLGKGRGHLHELRDQAGTLRSLIKDAVHIDDPRETGHIVDAAFRTALSGRPGPVAIEMCWDTMAREWEVDLSARSRAVDRPRLDPSKVGAAAQLLAAAERPMIMCGAGAQHAAAEVLALAELLDAPVAAFRSGRGVVAEDHPLGVSSVAARELFDEVDVLLGVGSRLEMAYMRWRDMTRYERKPAGGPKLVRIDVDADEMQRLEPDVAVVADAADACRALVRGLEGGVPGHELDGRALVRGLDGRVPVRGLDGRVPERALEGRVPAPAKARARSLILRVQPQMAYLDVIRELLPRDGFFVPEVSQVGFASYFGFPVLVPRGYVSEGHQGTLGFGFPTALGVKVANPERAVVSVNGDGGFLFGVQELATAAQYGIAVVAIVFNNNAFGNVRRDQLTTFGGRVVGADLVNPDFMRLAESFGIAARRVATPDELRPALEEALALDAPALIEVVTDPDAETSPWEFIMMARKPSSVPGLSSLHSEASSVSGSSSLPSEESSVPDLPPQRSEQ